MTTTSDPGTRALEHAIAWAVRLSSGAASEEDRRQFAIWQNADSLHEHAWTQVQQQLQPFGAARERGGAAARHAITAPGSSRRKMLQGTLGAVFAFGVAGYVVRRWGILDVFNADLATAIGDRREVVLADGSTLTLDAHSAVDIDFNAQARNIRLLRGQLFVHVARDPQRPLIVSTQEGTATALGTAFGVRLSDEGSHIAVTHSSVRVQPNAGDGLVVAAGSVALMTAHQAALLPALQGDTEMSWLKGYVTAVNRPLYEVIAALRPYLNGFVMLSEEAGALSVTGLFLLDDPARTMRQIAQTLPVTVTYHTEYFIQIAAR